LGVPLASLRAETPPANFVTAKSAILIDDATGNILYEKQADVPLPPASTTKVMTALVALEQKPIETLLRVSKNATVVPRCKVNVRVGEQWRLEDLLRCILLNSANDASVVIAEGTAGTVENFAALMNRKAKEIGARHTHFANPHGLDQKGHYSTARDTALIFHYASKDPLFCDIAGTMAMDIRTPSSRRICLKNHNRLLDQYPGMLYGKTGYTSKARRCFVGKATRDGRQLLVCVLGSQNHFRDAAKLLDYGFQTETKSCFSPRTVDLSSSTVVCSHEPARGTWVVQTASFSDIGKASHLRDMLLSQGYESFIETVPLNNGITWHRVKVGYYADLKSARKVCAQITRDFKLDPIILRFYKPVCSLPKT